MHKQVFVFALFFSSVLLLGAARADYWLTDDDQGVDTTTARAWSTTGGGARDTTHVTDTESSAPVVHPNSLIASVLLDHAELRGAIACFRDTSVCNQPRALVAEKIVAMLIRHDRREQRTLYPLAVFVEPEYTIKMKNEHVQVLDQLIDIVHADMNDTHVQSTLNNIINAVLKHVSEEERSFLPPLNSFLSKHKTLNTALNNKWQSITKTNLPTVIEMANNDHLMFKVLMKAFETTDDSVLKHKLAQVASAQKNIHMKCEQHVIYPLVEAKFGEQVVNKLKSNHDKIAAMSLKNVPANKFDQTAMKMLRAINTHMNMEDKYFTDVHAYLLNNPKACRAALKAFCNCVLNE